MYFLWDMPSPSSSVTALPLNAAHKYKKVTWRSKNTCTCAHLYVYVHISKCPEYQRLKIRFICVYIHGHILVYTSIFICICAHLQIPWLSTSHNTIYICIYIHAHILMYACIFTCKCAHLQISGLSKSQIRFIYVYIHAHI